MTFTQFKRIAETFRTDVHVFAHGEFAGTGKDTVCITFRKANGRESKVYTFRGTYAEVLNRLGIKVVTKSDVAAVREELAHYQKGHGKPNLFSNGKACDYSRQIAREEARLAAYFTDEWVRDWEW